MTSAMKLFPLLSCMLTAGGLFQRWTAPVVPSVVMIELTNALQIITWFAREQVSIYHMNMVEATKQQEGLYANAKTMVTL